MKYLAVLVLLLAIPATFAATFPKPVGYVNDFAGILPDRTALDQEVRDYETRTTIEIAIVTIESLPPDQTAASYAVELFQEWGIGKRGEDNGILVMIIKNGTTGNRLRIELGYGIQGYITGAEAGRILDAALPSYTQGDYQQTARTLLDGLYKQLEKYQPGVAANDGRFTDAALGFVLSNLPFIIFAIVITASAAMSNRCPYCIKGKLKCSGDYCVCQRCGKRVKRNRRYAPVLIGGGGFGGGSGGGFGGGGSGGGGAGR